MREEVNLVGDLREGLDGELLRIILQLLELDELHDVADRVFVDGFRVQKRLFGLFLILF